MQSKSGKVDVTIYRAGYGGVRIPAEMLAEEVAVTGDEGSVSNPTFAGTFTKPSETYDEPRVAFTMVLTSALLREVYPELSTNSTDRPTVAGQTVFGGNACVVREPAKLVIHWTCDGNSDDDWYFPNVLLSQNFTARFTPGEVLTLPVVAHVQPEAVTGALVYVGTGDLTEFTLFDETTGEYEPLASS
ncbi:hypothetical protein EOL73_03795 [Candidatus Saccharibacteria bacterium]|nr:hypothetical protein [Candidatus Saccharibacteria bacterium]